MTVNITQVVYYSNRFPFPKSFLQVGVVNTILPQADTTHQVIQIISTRSASQVSIQVAFSSIKSLLVSSIPSLKSKSFSVSITYSSLSSRDDIRKPK